MQGLRDGVAGGVVPEAVRVQHPLEIALIEAGFLCRHEVRVLGTVAVPVNCLRRDAADKDPSEFAGFIPDLSVEGEPKPL